MLINLAGRRIYYDRAGPDDGRVVCFTHSLDGGMWAEQLPPLLASGYRVLRLDMRHLTSAALARVSEFPERNSLPIMASPVGCPRKTSAAAAVGSSREPQRVNYKSWRGRRALRALRQGIEDAVEHLCKRRKLCHRLQAGYKGHALKSTVSRDRWIPP